MLSPKQLQSILNPRRMYLCLCDCCSNSVGRRAGPSRPHIRFRFLLPCDELAIKNGVIALDARQQIALPHANKLMGVVVAISEMEESQ
jgi:hypothetical protein